MKLRLPHKLQTALLTAFASVTFTTLSSGTLAAAFFLGSQAFADDSTEDVADGTIDIGDINLDAQAAIDEEEGTGEAQEPGSTPINQAGFNGMHGSSDQADLATTVSVSEGGADTAPAAAIVSGQTASVSVDSTPADDLGFTTQVTDGTTSSDYTPVITETATQAAQTVQTVGTTTQETTTSTGTTTTAKKSLLGISGISLGSGLSSPVSSSLGSFSLVSSPRALTGAVGVQLTGTELTGVTPTALDDKSANGNSGLNWDGETSNLTSWRLSFTLKETRETMGDQPLLGTNGKNTAGGDILRLLGDGSFRLETASGNKTTVANLISSGGTVNVVLEYVADYRGDTAADTGTYTLKIGESEVITLDVSNDDNTTFQKGTDSNTRLWTNGKKEWYSDIKLWQLNNNIISSFTWNGTAGSNNWTGEGAWLEGPFTNKGDAAFNGGGYEEVSVDTAVKASDVTMRGKDYTFNLLDGGSLVANTLSVTDHSLSLTGTGTMEVTGGVTIGTGASIIVEQDAKLAVAGGSGSTHAVINLNAASAGTLEIKSGSVSNTSAIGTADATLKLDNGTALYFDNNGNHAFNHNLELGGDATIEVYGTNYHPDGVTICGNVSGNDHMLTKQDLGQLTIYGKVDLGTLKLNSASSVKIVGDADDKGSIGSLNMANNSAAAEFINTNFSFQESGKSIVGNVTIGSGATGTVTATDSLNYDVTATITVKDGGGLNMGNFRWTVGANNKLVLNDGTITGTGDVNAALDPISNNDFIESSGTSSIVAPIRLRSNAVSFDVQSGVLTVSGNISQYGTNGLVKNGDGTLTLTGNNSYAGGTTINAGRLIASSANALGTGAITVSQGGTLELASSVSSISGGVNVGEGGTLVLANKTGESAVTANSLAFGHDAILDLANITVGSADPITLMSTTGGITGTLSEVEIQNLNNVPTGYTYSLQNVGSSLVLTFVPTKNLIWNTGSGNWDVNKTQQWHTAEAPASSTVFNQNDNVKFETGTSIATLTEGITAGTMTLESGVNLTLATGTNNLTTNDFVATGSASLTKSGTGKVHFGNAAGDADTLQSLTVNEGTVEFDGTVTVSGNIEMKDGDDNGRTLNLDGRATVNGTVNAKYGTISVGGDTSFATLDMGQGGNSTANTVVKTGATLTLNSLYMRGQNGNSVLTLEEGGTVVLPGNVIAMGLDDHGTVKRFNNNGQYSTENSNFTLYNVAVTVNNNVNVTIGNKLENSSLTSSGNVTLSNTANTLTATTVSTNTLIVSEAMSLGEVSVTGGTLSLTRSGVTIGSGTIASGAALKLGENNPFVVNAGAFVLSSGSTLDLSAWTSITGDQTITLGTVNADGSFATEGLSGVDLTFLDPTLKERATLNVQDGKLVLTFTQPAGLIWDATTSAVWSTDPADRNWHAYAETPGSSYFTTDSNVIFDNTASEKEVLVNTGITAGTMTVSDTYTFNVDGSGSLTAANLAGSGALTKTGAGTMTVNGAGAGYTGAVTIAEGVLSVTNSDFAAKMLREATGTGTLELNANATLAGGQASRMTGTLRIANSMMLTVGTADGQNNSLVSFESVVLDGGTIKWQSAGGLDNRLQNVTITGNGGTFQIVDINANAVEWTGTTTLQNGNLILLNTQWGGTWNIEKLTGQGNFQNTSTSGSENLTVTIGSIEDYQGDIDIQNPKTTLTATLNKNANIGTVTRANGGTVNLTAELGAGESASLGGGSVNNLTVNGGTLVVGNNLTATTVSVNNSTITNSGTGSSTLDIETLNVGKNGSIVSGNVSLGSEDAPMAHLHLENTLISKGDNAVYAAEVTFVGDLGESVGAGSTFKDTVSGATANGYVESAKVVIVENAAGSLTSNLKGHTIIHEGWTYTLDQDTSGNIYISLTASTERAMQGDYYVNSGTVTYGDSGNATGLERTNTLFVNGGNLTFTDTDLKTGVALHVHKDGVVTLGEGRNLNEGAVHVKAGATMTLIGSGTYVLSPAALGARGILPAGTVLAGGFTGTVLVSKDSVLNGTDLSGLVNGTDSRVGFNGATGSLKTGDIVQNIYLQDYGSQVALSLNTGTSGETHTFNGAITGTGTLARSYVTGSGDIGGIQNYEFSGDLNGWTGVFDNQVEGAANTTNLTFSENATVVNAEIKNGVAGSTGLLNVIAAGTEAKQFNKGVTATSFRASGGDVTFNGALRLTSNATADGAKLIINNSASVGGSLNGNVEVANTGNLTVGGTATLGGLTVNGMASFNNTVSASGAVTVNEGASLYLNGGGISLGEAASLTIKSGSMVGLSGWKETEGTPAGSGVVMTGFTGGRLYSGNGTVTVATGSYFMKDGAKFLYSGAEATDNRVTVHTDGDNAGTVDIIEAIYYNVHTGDSKTMDAVQAAAEEKGVTLDYIHIQSGGTLTGVTDENKGSFGISSVQGSGTMAVGAGTLTDSAAFANFTGTIRVDADGTFETDGTITRTITMNGGTLHATDNIDLSRNVTYTAGTTATLDISDGKSVTMTQAVTANLDKRGGGTLHITDTTSGGTRSPMLTGDLHVYDGTAVISSKRHNSDNCGVVNGSITVEQGADLIMEGFDALGHSNNCSEYTKKITLNAGTADNLTTLAFTRNGADPTTLQHTTLSTDIEMNGNTEMSGLRLNAFGTHNENNLGAGAYIHVSGMNNTISNTFAMRYNAYFQVDDNSELTLTGNMELFDQGAKDKKVIKTGAGVLDFAGANSSLYAIDIQAGLVEVTGNLTFNGTDSTQFLMAEGARFAVQNGATFNYRGWLFENNDGTHAAGTVTAAERSTTNILEDSNLVVGGMKLTNNNTGDQAISARLDGVQLMHTGGKVTINNAPTGTTQHIATLTIKTGETTLKSATLDAASVYPGATLTFSAGETVELGSTILNGGTVNLAGTINVSDLSAFAPQKGAGFIDKKKHSGASDTYNGFYQGSSYYLIQQEAADSEVTGSKSLTLTYKGSDSAVTAFAKEEDTNSYYFSVTEPSTLYYLNGEADADTTYSASSTGNNMYDGPGDGLYTTGIVMNAAGARLTLATNLRDYVRTLTGGSSGIEAKQNGTIDIQSGVTLHQSDLSGDSGVLVSLVGEGTFDLVGTTLKSVSSGLTDGTAWRGTVRASGTADNMNATIMGNVNSTLLLDGVQGTLTNADTRYVMKIELRNGGEGAVTDKALDNTFSTGANRVFSNTVSGSGDILMTGEASGSTQSIAFTGDVSNWTGDFTTATQGTTNLAFNNKAAVIYADVMEGAGSTINLSAGPAVDAGGQSAVQVFNGNITASSLTVEAGADTTLDNTTAISGVIDATAENAQLHVQGTTTAQTVQVGNGHVDINDTDGDLMATVTGGSGTAVMDGGLELSSGDNLATIKGATQGQLSTVAGANVKVMSEAASLKLENLVLSDDTFVRGTSGNGNLIISGRVEQQMSTNNTRAKADTTVTSALTMTGTTGTTMEYDNNKVHNLDFTSMCQLAQISGSAGTLVFDFTGMDGYDDWELNFSAYGFIGVKFDPAVAMAFKAANQQNEAIYADNLQVVARTTDADGQVVERIGYYNNGGNGAVVGSIVYFQVPEPTTGTLSLLALAALAARRRKH